MANAVNDPVTNSVTEQQTPTIDLRPYDDYIKGHLAGATHFELNALDGLWHELPPKHCQLNLCVSRDIAPTALELFEQQHYQVNHVYFAEELASEELVSGTDSRRLWYGNPLLEKHSALFQFNQVDSAEQKPVAVDIGCGSGRDSILMATLGYKVIAIDVYDQALQRLNASAKRWNAEVDTKIIDCRKQPEALIELLQQEPPALIMQSRFLHRPLVDMYENYLPVGCKVAIHTFLEGAAKFGSPKNPDFLLKNDELSERFNDWSVLIDQVHTLEDGRPLSLFVAQKF